MGRISGWIFIGIGFVVIAVSIFMYDTLKFFIVLGGIMTLYGLGKLTVEKMENKYEKPEDDGPVLLDERQNPYLQRQTQKQQHKQQQVHHQHHQQAQHRHIQHKGHQQHRQVQHRGKYCTSCGGHVAASHSFCGYCGAQA
jgi:hypothetical protein